MMIPDNCRCAGAICDCTGTSILKDGGRLRISPMLRDGSISGEKHGILMLDSAPDAAAGLAEGARTAMISDMATAHRGRDPVAAAKEMRDHFRAEEIAAGKTAFADAKATGLDDAAATAESARSAMIRRTNDAWRAAI